MKEAGVTQTLSTLWSQVFTPLPIHQNTNNDLQLIRYDFTWKSFKELYDITI